MDENSVNIKNLVHLASYGLKISDITDFRDITMHNNAMICLSDLEDNIVIVSLDRLEKAFYLPGKGHKAIANPTHPIVAVVKTDYRSVIFHNHLTRHTCGYKLCEEFRFWTWLSESVLGLVTQKGVFNWMLKDIIKDNDNNDQAVGLTKVFSRCCQLGGYTINTYIADISGMWHVIGGYTTCRKHSHMQLYSVELKSYQIIKGSSPTFSNVRMTGNAEDSILLFYAVENIPDGTAELHIREVNCHPNLNRPFKKKMIDISSYKPGDSILSICVNPLIRIVYILSECGSLTFLEIDQGKLLYKVEVSDSEVPHFRLAVPYEKGNGFICISSEGSVEAVSLSDEKVLECLISVTLCGPQKINMKQLRNESLLHDPLDIVHEPDPMMKKYVNDKELLRTGANQTKNPDPKLDKMSTLCECSICLGIFNDPKSLDCEHHFCKDCLEEILQYNCGGFPYIRCPMCNKVQEFTSKNSTVSSLKCQLFLKQVLETLHGDRSDGNFGQSTFIRPMCCEEEVCWFCGDCNRYPCDLHAADHKDRCKNVVPIRYCKSKETLLPYCLKHKCFKYYGCKTCVEVICPYCKQSEHRDHMVMLFNEYAEIFKGYLRERIESTKKYNKEINNMLINSKKQDTLKRIEEKAQSMRIKFASIIDIAEEQMKKEVEEQYALECDKWKETMRWKWKLVKRAETLLDKTNVDVVWRSSQMLSEMPDNSIDTSQTQTVNQQEYFDMVDTTIMEMYRDIRMPVMSDHGDITQKMVIPTDMLLKLYSKSNLVR